MKKFLLRQALALVTLLASSASMAATINVTASNSSPSIGEQFTMTLSGDLSNVFAATIEMAFDPTKVAYVSGTGLGAFSVFVKNSPASATPTSFYIEVPVGSVSGPQLYAQLTFQQVAAGGSNIVFYDDGGGASGWPDFTTGEPVIATYNNVPAPAAVWLLGTGLAGLSGRRWLRRKISS